MGEAKVHRQSFDTVKVSDNIDDVDAKILIQNSDTRDSDVNKGTDRITELDGKNVLNHANRQFTEEVMPKNNVASLPTKLSNVQRTEDVNPFVRDKR